MIAKILVPTDGSEPSILAARYAAYLATKTDCKVTLIHIVEPIHLPYSIARFSDEKHQELEAAVEEAGKSILRLTQKELVDAGIAADTIMQKGRPGNIIRSVAEEGKYDLIIVGSTGRGGVSRALLGSVSQEVLHTAPCPVLVVKEKGK
jgi:nucleotide-binding universal stress UspA family protein